MTTASRTCPFLALGVLSSVHLLKGHWSPSDRKVKEPAEEIFVQPSLASLSTGTKLVLRSTDVSKSTGQL